MTTKTELLLLENKLLEDASDYIKDPFVISEIREILYCKSLTVQKIFRRWLEKLNEYFFYDPIKYSRFIDCLLLEEVYNNPLMKQKSWEFEASWYFLDYLFKSKIKLDEDKECWQYLFFIALVYGKYPGMVVKPLSFVLNKYSKYRLVEASLQKLFEELFSKYKSPVVLVKHIFYMTTTEMDCLMHVMQGNNIRTFRDLPMYTSRKESYLICNKIPEEVKFSNEIIRRLIIASKLRKENTEGDYELVLFLDSNRIFKYNLNVFEEDINFWKKVFYYWSIYQLFGYIETETFLSFIIYKKYIENSYYDLKKRSVNSIIRDVAFFQNDKYKDEIWKGRSLPEHCILHEGIEYSISEIISGNELFKEGIEMENCVFNYIISCIKGYLTILTVKKNLNGRWKRYLTVCVKENEITELKGKANRSPSYNDIDIVNRLIQKLDVKQITKENIGSFS